jgi:hypothetical protein
MSKKPSPAEEERDAALDRFGIGLNAAAEAYATGKCNNQSAALAVAATIGCIQKISPQKHLLAPLYEALEIIEAAIEPAMLPHCRRNQAMVMDIDAYIGKPLPPIAEFEKPELSGDAIAKVAGCIAVECQRRNGVSINKALTIVARDSDAAKKLKNFRYNMLEKNSPKHAKDFYFDSLKMVTQRFDGDPKLLAQKTLQAYRNMLGQKS